MNDQMAVYLTVEDPEAMDPVQQAYCVLTEVHANFKTKSLIAIFECWRTKEACNAKRRSFSAIQVQLEPDRGGEAYFSQHGLDGAAMQLGPRVLDFCVEHSAIFQTAVKADAEVENVAE